MSSTPSAGRLSDAPAAIAASALAPLPPPSPLRRALRSRLSDTGGGGSNPKLSVRRSR